MLSEKKAVKRNTLLSVLAIVLLLYSGARGMESTFDGIEETSELAFLNAISSSAWGQTVKDIESALNSEELGTSPEFVQIVPVEMATVSSENTITGRKRRRGSEEEEPYRYKDIVDLLDNPANTKRILDIINEEGAPCHQCQNPVKSFNRKAHILTHHKKDLHCAVTGCAMVCKDSAPDTLRKHFAEHSNAP